MHHMLHYLHGRTCVNFEVGYTCMVAVAGSVHKSIHCMVQLVLGLGLLVSQLADSISCNQ